MKSFNPLTGFQFLPNCVPVEFGGRDGQEVTRAVGHTTLRTLNRVLGVNRPSLVAKDVTDQCSPLRETIQRKFTGDRVKNREAFTDYILALQAGRPGALPPITLYCPSPLMQEDDGGVQFLMASGFVAADGETQVDALFAAAEINAEVWDMPLSFIVHAGIGNEAIRVIVHDLNAYGRPIKEAEVVALNEVSPITRAIAEGVEQAGVTMDMINRSGSGWGSKYRKFSAVHRGMVALAAGIHFGPEQITSRNENFLKAFKHPGTENGLDLELITHSVANLVRLPWGLKREVLGDMECKILGAIVSRKGAEMVNVQTVSHMKEAKAKIHGRCGIRKKFALLSRGLI